MTFRHVLAPVDLSRRSRASVAEAIRIAHACGARLTVLHVAPPLVDEETREELFMALSSLTGLRQLDPSVHMEVVEGDPEPEILAFAAARDVDMIVLGSRRRGVISRALVESTGDRVTSQARCSVLVVPEREPEAGVRRRRTKILCAVDLTDSSSATLEAAVDLTRASAGHLTVLHVVDPWRWAEGGHVSTTAIQAARDRLEQTASERLSLLLARYPASGLDVEALVLFGIPQTVLAQAAVALGSGTVVLGAHSRKWLGYELLGATARSALRRAPCPVLLVRPLQPQAVDARHSEPVLTVRG